MKERESCTCYIEQNRKKKDKIEGVRWRERDRERLAERERDAEIEANLRDKATQRQRLKQKLKENRTTVPQRNGDRARGRGQEKVPGMVDKREVGAQGLLSG